MQVSTPRLLVQRIDEAMAVSMLDGVPRPGDRWAPGYPLADELDAVRAWLDGPRPAESSSPFGPFVIRLLPDRIACGGAGFFGPPDDDGVVEFGYGLVPAARGQGLVTEAVRALLTLAAQHGAGRARADTDLDNTPSQRVLQRLGLREVRRDDRLVHFEAALPVDPPGTVRVDAAGGNGPWRDCVPTAPEPPPAVAVG